MHVDARQLDSGAIIDADLCIVGAGAAGVTIALEWTRKGKKVALLEGGGFEYDYAMQELYKGNSEGQRYFPLEACRMHYFGGTMAHWGGFCSDLDAIDFEQRYWVPMSGWPFDKKHLVPFYRRAQRTLELGPYEYHQGYWLKRDPAKVPLPLDPANVWHKMWQFSPPTRFNTFYRADIVDSPDVTLYTHANVVHVNANEGASAVTSVTTRDFDGTERTFQANHFILACGAMQNARLLLCSNDVAPNGLGNDQDLVGRHFMDHPEITAGSVHFAEAHDMSFYEWIWGKTAARAEWAISAERQRESEILNCTASLWPAGPQDFDRIDGYGDGAAMRDYDGRSGRFGAGLNGSVFGLSARLEQAPNPDSRVYLDSEKDALGMRRLTLDWQLTPLDRKSVRRTFEIIAEEVGRQGLGRVRLMDWMSEPDDAAWPSFLGSGWHHMGTTRMSGDPSTGVVDSNGTVHGIPNLHIAGTATYPTAGSANPTLTLVAMALRQSDHLATLV